MTRNLIRIEDPDIPIYRTFRLAYFRDVIKNESLTLVAPRLWDDPFENFITGCAITYFEDGKYRQAFFDRVRKPVRAQCWSLAAESDALWRIYSTVTKDPQTTRNTSFDSEGVKVRTTARKLLGALWEASPFSPENACFLGQVRYMAQRKAAQLIADEAGRAGLRAFASGRGHAETLLIKREPFEHEREVRLIYVEYRDDKVKDILFTVPVDPNTLFDEVVLDPRLGAYDVGDRESELRSLGFSGPVKKSDLYQRCLYEIIIPDFAGKTQAAD